MKKFEFPLARVLEWRRTRATLEESRLGRLNRELRGLESRAAITRTQQEQSERALRASASLTGTELVAFDSHKRFLTAECERLSGLAANCRTRIAAQIQVIAQAQRDVRLLERLHHRKHAAWQAELWKEIDREAEELHLAAVARR